MSTTTTPQFTESTIVAAQSLAVNANPAPRGTIDLTGAYGAFLMLRVGFQNLTAWDDALAILIRPVLGGGAGLNIHTGSNISKTLGLSAATARSTVSVNASIGDTSLTVADGSLFAKKDLVMIQNGDLTFTRLEFARVSKKSGNVLYFDAPLRYAHTAVQADFVTSNAQTFPRLWLEGGMKWEVVFDSGQATTGASVVVEAIATTYTNDITV